MEKHGYKLVTFTIDDPDNPKNWSKAYKWWCTLVIASVCFVVAFASSVVTGDFKDLMRDFDMGLVVISLSVSLMVCGFGVGPLVWSPIVRIASCISLEALC